MSEIGDYFRAICGIAPPSEPEFARDHDPVTGPGSSRGKHERPAQDTGEREGEYELRCLSPQDLVMLGRSLESVYATDGLDGDLRWSADRAESLWTLIAMVLGHEGGGRLRRPGLRSA